MRTLSRIETIAEIFPIEGADAIEAARVGGWTVVVKKGEFEAGQKAVYFEIDTFLPEGNPAWQFLVDKSSRQFGLKRGHVLKTLRFRGQLSQGLLLPLSLFDASVVQVEPGADLSELLGVEKFEKPEPVQLSGQQRGSFPAEVPRTDQERAQNLTGHLPHWAASNIEWELTEKLEGRSCTFALLGGIFRVCSRNVDLTEDANNLYWKMALDKGIEAKLREHFTGRNIALQGELVGPDIEGNIYGIKDRRFYLYDCYDVDAGKYFSPEQRRGLVRLLGIEHVPVLGYISLPAKDTLACVLELAEGTSAVAPVLREGVVFKSSCGQKSFKAISNAYLLKQKG